MGGFHQPPKGKQLLWCQGLFRLQRLKQIQCFVKFLLLLLRLLGDRLDVLLNLPNYVFGFVHRDEVLFCSFLDGLLLSPKAADMVSNAGVNFFLLQLNGFLQIVPFLPYGSWVNLGDDVGRQVDDPLNEFRRKVKQKGDDGRSVSEEPNVSDWGDQLYVPHSPSPDP